MFHKKEICVVEFTAGALRATYINPHAKNVRHRTMPYSAGAEQAAAGELRAFLADASRRCRVVVLIPRAACVMKIFRFPPGDPAEIRDMAELQFVHNTPHERQDVIVDAQVLAWAGRAPLCVAGIMTTAEALAPGFRVLERAGSRPAVVTVNAQRLAALARAMRLCGSPQEAVVLGVRLDGSLLWTLLRGDTLLFSREEDSGAEAAAALTGFVDHCRKEFPGLAIQKGVLIADPQWTRDAQSLPGFDLEVRELSDLVRSAEERTAFDLSPVAFLDLLLAKDNSKAVFDLSPKGLRAEREQGRIRSVARHFIIISGILLAGLLVKAGAEYHQKRTVVASLRAAVEQNKERVQELEDKARMVATVEGRITERRLVTTVLADLARAIPKGARLSQADLKEGVLEIHGEADGLESARTFLAELAGREALQDVRLVSIDKRPTEAAEAVLFRMKAKVR